MVETTTQRDALAPETPRMTRFGASPKQVSTSFHSFYYCTANSHCLRGVSTNTTILCRRPPSSHLGNPAIRQRKLLRRHPRPHSLQSGPNPSVRGTGALRPGHPESGAVRTPTQPARRHPQHGPRRDWPIEWAGLLPDQREFSEEDELRVRLHSTGWRDVSWVGARPRGRGVRARSPSRRQEGRGEYGDRHL